MLSRSLLVRHVGRSLFQKQKKTSHPRMCISVCFFLNVAHNTSKNKMTKANAHRCHASVKKLATAHSKCHKHQSMLVSGMSMKAYFGTESSVFHNNTQYNVCKNMLNR